MPKSPPEEEPQSAPEWMVTFSDMIGLLVTFFIMLMTFSTTEKEKYARMAGSLQGQFGLLADPKASDSLSVTPPPPTIKNRVTEDGLRQAREDLNLIRERMETLVRRPGTGNRIEFEQVAGGTRLSISCDTPFPAGSHFLTEPVKETLREVADLLRLHTHRVIVVGHAGSEGPLAPGSEELSELAAARALAVAEYLTTLGRIPSSRVTVASRGDLDEPRTAPGGDSASASRRVEILVLPNG
jgi:chemotaxis protein MotB